MKLEDFVETCDRFDPPVILFDDDAIDEVVLYEGLIYDIKDRMACCQTPEYSCAGYLDGKE